MNLMLSRLFANVFALTLLVSLGLTARAEVRTLIHAGLGEADQPGGLAAVRDGGPENWRMVGQAETDDDVADGAVRAARSAASVRLDGSSGLVLDELPANPKTHFGLEAWVKPTSAGGSRAVMQYGGNGGVGIEQQNDGVWGVIYGKATVGFRKLPADRWTHVALVVEDNASTLYINGQPAGSADATPWGYQKNAGLGVGVRPDGSGGFFEGNIDEARVFTFEPGGFEAGDLLHFQDAAMQSIPTVEASIRFDREPIEDGLTFERDGTKFMREAGKDAWAVHQTRMPQMPWMRSFRLTFTDDRFRHGNMPVVDVRVEYLLDTWGGMAAFADTDQGSRKLGMRWGGGKRWRTAQFRLDNAHFGARQHGSPDNQLSSDGYDLRLYAPNAPLLIRSVKVRGYPREGTDLAWPRLIRAKRPTSTGGPVLAFERGMEGGLSFAVRNLARQTAPLTYRCRLIDVDGQTVAERSGDVNIAGETEDQLVVGFDSSAWPYGPYRYQFDLAHAQTGEKLANLEGGLMVHDGRDVPKARPGEFLYGLQHVRDPLGEIDQAWFSLLGVDIIRSLGGHGRQDVMSRYDEIVPQFTSRNMSIMAMIDPPKPGDPITYKPEGMDPEVRERELTKLEAFLEDLAAKYRDEITYYELGNEPDLRFFYPGPVEEYVNSFRRMRAAIKRGNPDAVVMTGGLCFFGAEGDRRARRIIELLAPDGVDAWSYHAHGPGYEAERDALERTRGAVAKHGGLDLPFIETESGFSAVGQPQLLEQARTCVEKIIYAQSEGMPVFFWFALHFKGNTAYTSVEHLREPRPVMLAYRQMVQRLRGHRFVESYALADGAVRGHLFHQPDTGQAVLALWSTRPGATPLRLRLAEPGVTLDGPATLYDMWGNPAPLTVRAGSVADVEVHENTSYITWNTAAGGPGAPAVAEQPSLLAVDQTQVLPLHRHTPRAVLTAMNPENEAARLTLSGQVVIDGEITSFMPQEVQVAGGDAVRVVLEGEPITVPDATPWPRLWRVFASRGKASGLGEVDLSRFDRIPESIGSIEGRWATRDGDAIDIGALTGSYHEKAPALLFAEVWSPVDQTVQVGAAADWWMQWVVNGEPVYDTLARGNGGAMTITAHVFDMPLRAGWNLIAVRVLSGSAGWLLASGGPEAVGAALHSDAPPRRVEVTLTGPDGAERARRVAAVPEPMIAPPLPEGGLPTAASGWFTRQPLAKLGEAELINEHLVQPDQSRWWAGEADLSALAWAYSDEQSLWITLAVRDDKHVDGADAVRVVLQPIDPGLTSQASAGVTFATPGAAEPGYDGQQTGTWKIKRDKARGLTWYHLQAPRAALGGPGANLVLEVHDDDGWGAKQRLVGSPGDGPLILSGTGAAQ